MKKLLLFLAAITLYASEAWAGYQPIARTVPQYVDSSGDPYSGAVLKAYSAGTTTNITIATDSTGGTLVTSVALNSDGFPEVSSAIIIPHIEESYKLALYPTQAAADSDTGAIWTIDNMTAAIGFGESTVTLTTNTVLTVAAHCNAQLIVTGTTTLTLPAITSAANACLPYIYNGGSGTVTLDGNASETINAALTWDIPPAGNGQLVAGDTTWQFNGSMGIPQSFNAGGVFFYNNGFSTLAAATDGEFMGLTSSLPSWKSITDYTETAPTASDEIMFGDATDSNLHKKSTLKEILYLGIAHDHITGLSLTSDTDTDHDILIGTGQAADSTNAKYLTASSAMTKQIDASWVAGDDNGGLFSGSVAADTVYYAFVIEKDSDDSLDFGFDTSETAANIPSGYTEYRKIGFVVTDSSANIEAIASEGLFVSAAQDLSSAGGSNLTILHGFGIAPTDISAVLVCATADLGYAVGDRVYVMDMQDPSGNRGLHIYTNDTSNIRVQLGSATDIFSLLRLDSPNGQATAIDRNDWDLVIEARVDR